MSRFPFILFTFLAVVSTPLYAAITGKLVPYKAGDTSLVGYIVYDKAVQGKRPAVIVVPDWWGHSNYARDRAEALAKLGYTAIVMDMYGDGKYVEFPETKKQMTMFTADPKTMEVRFDATYQTLIKNETVDSNHIAAIGYSLGGRVVLEMARRGKDLDGVASIWGVIPKTDNPAKKGFVKAKILVQQAEDDSSAPMEDVNKLKKEMAAAGVETKVIVYPGTKHGFTRPDATTRAEKHNLPIRYNDKAAKQSWKDLSKFLKAAFK